MNSDNTLAIISLAIAAYGALLASFLAIQQYRHSRRSAEVRIANVLTPMGKRRLRATVIGRTRPITIQAIGLLLDDENRSISYLEAADPALYPPPDFPIRLQDGEAASMTFELRKPIWGGFAIDASGNMYVARLRGGVVWKVRSSLRQRITWPVRRKLRRLMGASAVDESNEEA